MNGLRFEHPTDEEHDEKKEHLIRVYQEALFSTLDEENAVALDDDHRMVPGEAVPMPRGEYGAVMVQMPYAVRNGNKQITGIARAESQEACIDKAVMEASDAMLLGAKWQSLNATDRASHARPHADVQESPAYAAARPGPH